MPASITGLEDKRVLILGGGQGMGESTARLLASVGCHVAIADMDIERAERVSSALAKTGVRSTAVAVDATDDQGLIDAIAGVERDFGPLDGMVTIIGMAAWKPVLETSMDIWDLDHRRNLRYFFLAAREVGGSMIRRNVPGSIVCVASIDGIRSSPFHASYGAAKAGLINLVKTLAAEWSQHGLRINAVAPGAIITPRFPDQGTEGERKIMAKVPMQRRGTTEEIAKAALFFLSDLSSYVTGQTLAVDGGYTALGPLDYSAVK